MNQEEQNQQIQELFLLQRVAQRINSILELDVLLEEIVGDVAETFGYTRSGVLLKDDVTNELVIAAVRGWTTNYHLKGERFKIGEYGMVGHVAATGETYYAPDVTIDPYYQVSEELTRSEVDIPLKIRGRLIGVFSTQHNETDAFSPERIQLLEALAGHIATAIKNARLFHRERLEKQRALVELDKAHDIKHSLFPKQSPTISRADSYKKLEREKWEQVKDIFDAALQRAPDERERFLAENCNGDEELRREVQSLLSSFDGANSFLQKPAVGEIADIIKSNDKKLEAEKRFGHYQILKLLGAGGMGEVYLAEDTRLDRKVAVKFLNEEFSRDADKLNRFIQEAKAASALNHPNILTVYEIGETNGKNYIATEFIEGETLREHLSQKESISLNAILKIGVQVSEALAAAHRAGIVHRDIKPENIMIREDGYAKVLDFGLAKLTEKKNSGKVSLEGETKALVNTNPGTVMGTVSYMSPEQARGKDTDARTDIWSLGVVLYEMLTGHLPFAGETMNDSIAAILTKEPPPLAEYVPRIPAEIERIIRLALEKLRERRYQAAKDLAADLKNLKRELEKDSLQYPIPCPQCNQHNSAEHSFCEKCGAALSKECPNCGQKIRRDSPFCGLCGHHLTGVQTVAFPAEANKSARETRRQVKSGGERRQTSIMCSNLIGYAEMVETLAPEETEETVSRIKNAAERIVAAHGGVINYFTEETITALFGIPVAHEDDFVRAVRTAIELHAEVRRLTENAERKLGQKISLSTGINTGLVIVQPGEGGEQKYKITGSALQIASKLAAFAEADEVLLSRDIQRLVARFFNTELKCHIALKSKSEPETVFRVLGESPVQTRLEAAAAIGLTEYTGREKELNALLGAVEKTLGGEGQFVVIVGEAGAGKSRLLFELRRTLEEKPVVVWQAQCHLLGGNLPYQPFIDLLKNVFALPEHGSPEQRLAGAVSGIRAFDSYLEDYIPVYLHLLSLESDEYALPEHLKGEDLRLAILEAIAAVFTLDTKRGSTLILLEDWHWVDDGSEEALKKLVGLASARSLMIVVTCRPERSFEWGFSSHHAQLHLPPLHSSDSIRLVKSFLGADELPAGLGEFVYKRTGGNPFFIEEVCRTLIENNRIQIIDRSARLNNSLEELDLPDTVQAVIRTRLDKLDGEALATLRHASVIGQEFSRPVLEGAFASRHLSESLEKLQSLGLIQQLRVVPEATYRFNHALTQEVAYESMLLHHRRELHETVGQTIENLSTKQRIEERMELLAYHYSRAENWTKAAHYGCEAAERAGKLIRFSEALKMLEQVEGWLTKLPESGVRQETLVETLFRQERICETLGLRDKQETLISRVFSLLDPAKDKALLAEAYIRRGELDALLGRFTPAERALNESLTIRRSLADAAGERHALRSLGFLYWHQGRYDDAVACNESALDIDQSLNDSAGCAQDLTNLGSVLRSRGDQTKALEHLREAVRINEELGRTFSQVYTLDITANVYRDMGKIPEAMDYYRQAYEVANLNRMPVQQTFMLKAMANLCWEQGAKAECLQHCGELVALARSLGIKSELAQALSIYGQRLAADDKPKEAISHLVEASELFAQLDNAEQEIQNLIALARVYESAAAYRGKSQAVWGRIKSLREKLDDSAGQIEALSEMARLIRLDGEDKESALGCYREALEIATEANDAPAQGDLLNNLGIVEWERANYNAALDYYEKAYRVFEQLNDRIHAGFILNSIGVTLKHSGRLEEARSRLEEAIQIHQASGQKLLEGHALAALGDVFGEMKMEDKAIEYYRASLDIRQSLGDRLGEGWMLHHLSKIYLRQGATRHARELFEQALTIADEINSAPLKQACSRLDISAVEGELR